jgi:hypothetical protein
MAISTAIPNPLLGEHLYGLDEFPESYHLLFLLAKAGKMIFLINYRLKFA